MSDPDVDGFTAMARALTRSKAPSELERARLKTKVLAATVNAPATPKSTLAGAKIVLGVLGAVALIGAAMLRSPPPLPELRDEQKLDSAAPREVTRPPATDPPVVAPLEPAEKPAPRKAKRPGAATEQGAAPPTAPMPVRADLSVVLRIDAHLRAREWSEALRLLDAAGPELSPAGAFAEEAAALRALALCGDGQVDAGLRAAAQLAPTSSYAERIERECSP